GLSCKHLDLRLDLRLVDECRPIGNDLLDLWAAAGESGHTRWTVEHERRDLAREPLHRRSIIAAHADSALHLGGIVRLAGEPTVGCGGADELAQNVLEAQSKMVETLTKHAVGELRLRE